MNKLTVTNIPEGSIFIFTYKPDHPKVVTKHGYICMRTRITVNHNTIALMERLPVKVITAEQAAVHLGTTAAGAEKWKEDCLHE